MISFKLFFDLIFAFYSFLYLVVSWFKLKKYKPLQSHPKFHSFFYKFGKFHLFSFWLFQLNFDWSIEFPILHLQSLFFHEFDVYLLVHNLCKYSFCKSCNKWLLFHFHENHTFPFDFGSSSHPICLLPHNLVSRRLRWIFHLILSLLYKVDIQLHLVSLKSLPSCWCKSNKKCVDNARLFVSVKISDFINYLGSLNGREQIEHVMTSFIFCVIAVSDKENGWILFVVVRNFSDQWLFF